MKKKDRIFTPDNLRRIRQMAAEGSSSFEIAESIGSTPASVRVMCCQHNSPITLSKINLRHFAIQRTFITRPLMDVAVKPSPLCSLLGARRTPPLVSFQDDN